MASAAVPVLRNYINGQFVECKGTRTLDVMNPATDEVINKVPMSTPEEVDECIQAAHKAFLKWKEVPAIQRIQPLMRCLTFIKERKDEIARSITINHGKEFAAAQAEVVRAYQMIESALCTPEWQKGEFMENVATDIDEYSIRVPLGVFVHIPPFNFPGMVPFWFWPYAIAAGNTYIIKSNEVTPVTMQLMIECIHQAGFPPGVINYIHGDVEVANLLIDHPLTKGVSSVGSTPVAKTIYARASALGKRAQCHGGANNYLMVMPSANLDEIIPNILNSVFGNTGQRCLAGSTIVAVGNDKWYQTVRDKFVEAVKTKIRPGSGFDEGAAMGPLVSKKALNYILGQIEEGLAEGAKLIVDGRNVTVPGFPRGYWLGACVFEGAKPGMKCYEEEIFGPVCRIDHIPTLDEAIARINNHPKGNATTIYTENGSEARRFRHECQPGMIGINIGLVAPIAWFPFSGAKDSFIGTLRAQGREAFEFFTQEHVVIERFHGHGKIEWD